jgi:hypothetical protein
MCKAGWYGLNSEGLGCGTLANYCDYSTYSSGAIKAGGRGEDILTACAAVGLCNIDFIS